ncbi:MAG: STAS domain-containing protein [Opitutales bacterium]
MTSPASASYLVRQDPCEAQVKIIGRATHLNCRPVGRFLRLALNRGVERLYVDFAECQGMDSTFLGMIASSAMQARGSQCKPRIILTRLGDRNFQLIRNLGIGPLVETSAEAPPKMETLEDQLEAESSAKSDILEAHESLVAADEANREKFENVLTFLRKEVDPDGNPDLVD